MLASTLLFMQVCWEKGWLVRLTVVFGCTVIVCWALAELFTVVDLAWGI